MMSPRAESPPVFLAAIRPSGVSCRRKRTCATSCWAIEIRNHEAGGREDDTQLFLTTQGQGPSQHSDERKGADGQMQSVE